MSLLLDCRCSVLGHAVRRDNRPLLVGHQLQGTTLRTESGARQLLSAVAASRQFTEHVRCVRGFVHARRLLRRNIPDGGAYARVPSEFRRLRYERSGELGAAVPALPEHVLRPVRSDWTVAECGAASVQL